MRRKSVNVFKGAAGGVIWSGVPSALARSYRANDTTTQGADVEDMKVGADRRA
jgi:hypothetical protein